VTVTLDVWRVPPRAVPGALWRMARLPRALRRAGDVGFVKLLGTGRGSGFGVAAGDPCRWAALTVWTASPRPLDAFDRIATARCRLTLRPIAARGRWAGREPFAPITGPDQTTHGPAALSPTAPTTRPAEFGPPHHRPADPGPVLVLTRARLRPSRALAFWRAIGPVAARLRDADGLLAAFGIGEAPIGFQGTVSVWAGGADVNGFAYRTPEHAEVVRATPVRRWYAEELFARLDVLDVTGDREVIGWSAERA
jgi:hypothetical protein